MYTVTEGGNNKLEQRKSKKKEKKETGSQKRDYVTFFKEQDQG